MKKSIVFFYCVIICFCNVWAKNYIDYNIKILNAQSYLLDAKFDSALVVYKDAFNSVSKPFPKDIDNATLVAYYLDSIDLMTHYIKVSIEMGRLFKRVMNKYRSYYKNREFWNEMKNVSIKTAKRIETESDSTYLSLKEMFLNDQKARKSIFNKEAKMHFVDSLNAIKLNSIVSETYYPGFLTIGIHNAYNEMVITDVLMLHLSVDNYEQLIVNAMIRGEITPYMACYIFIRQYKANNKTSDEPEVVPDLIKKCLRYYQGERYEQLQNKGFDFHGIV